MTDGGTDMVGKPRSSKPDETTRERILRHAMLRFSNQSYESTGLREIAADAGVDVAWVHRSFGSKEKLFHDSLRHSIENHGILDDPDEHTLSRLCDEMLRPLADDELSPIHMIVRSFSSPEASKVICEFATTQLVMPMARAMGPGSEVRIALALSALIGFAIMHEVVGMSTITEADKQDLSRRLHSLTSGILSA